MKTRRDQPLPVQQREALGGVVRHLGERKAAEVLGVSTSTVLRGATGLPLQRSCRTAIAARLEQLTTPDDAGAPPPKKAA